MNRTANGDSEPVRAESPPSPVRMRVACHRGPVAGGPGEGVLPRRRGPRADRPPPRRAHETRVQPGTGDRTLARDVPGGPLGYAGCAAGLRIRATGGRGSVAGRGTPSGPKRSWITSGRFDGCTGWRSSRRSRTSCGRGWRPGRGRRATARRRSSSAVCAGPTAEGAAGVAGVRPCAVAQWPGAARARPDDVQGVGSGRRGDGSGHGRVGRRGAGARRAGSASPWSPPAAARAAHLHLDGADRVFGFVVGEIDGAGVGREPQDHVFKVTETAGQADGVGGGRRRAIVAAGEPFAGAGRFTAWAWVWGPYWTRPKTCAGAWPMLTAPQPPQVLACTSYSVTLGGGGAWASVTWRRCRPVTGAPARSAPEPTHADGEHSIRSSGPVTSPIVADPDPGCLLGRRLPACRNDRSRPLARVPNP